MSVSYKAWIPHMTYKCIIYLLLGGIAASRYWNMVWGWIKFIWQWLSLQVMFWWVLNVGIWGRRVMVRGWQGIGRGVPSKRMCWKLGLMLREWMWILGVWMMGGQVVKVFCKAWMAHMTGQWMIYLLLAGWEE